MRKNYFFALLLLCGFSCMTAQAQKTLSTTPGTNYTIAPEMLRTTGAPCDTGYIGYPIVGTPTLIGSGGWGYVSGHNDYLDEAKAERFENLVGTSEIFGVRILFGAATSSGPTAKVVVKVWNDVGGQPGTVLHSQDLLIDDIISSNNDVLAVFPGPIAVSGAYFVGIELTYAAGDTVGIVTNTSGDTNPATAWELWSGGGWYPFDTSASWGLRVAMAIHPFAYQSNFAATITPPSATIASGNSVALTASGANTFLWTPSNGLSCTTCPNPVASPTTTTTYTVVTTDTVFGCSASETITITVSGVGIEDGLFGGKATAYPNPSTGQFVLAFNQNAIANLDISITNHLGQVVYKEALANFTGDYRKAMDLTSFAAGMYTLRVTDGEKQFVQKLIFN